MKLVTYDLLADVDIEAAINHYELTAAMSVVERFVNQLAKTTAIIGRSPRLGSPMFAELVDLEGLRYRTVTGFPYAVFYRELVAEVRVIRVLHHGRDVLGLMGA